MFSSQIKYNKKTLQRFKFCFPNSNSTELLINCFDTCNKKVLLLRLVLNAESRRGRSSERSHRVPSRKNDRIFGVDVEHLLRAVLLVHHDLKHELFEPKDNKTGLICFRRKTLDLMTIEKINDYKDNEGLPF